MEWTAHLNVDPVFGIQYRAVRRIGGPGWEAQWRPLRAIRTFPTFSYIPRAERFPSEEDALEFVRRNVGAIVSRTI
jgi:hypothetical protein